MRALTRRAGVHLSHHQSPRRRWRSISAGFGALARQLDADAMHEAAQLLLGNHDFTTFRDSNCQAKSPVKTLDRCESSA